MHSFGELLVRYPLYRYQPSDLASDVCNIRTAKLLPFSIHVGSDVSSLVIVIDAVIVSAPICILVS